MMQHRSFPKKISRAQSQPPLKQLGSLAVFRCHVLPQDPDVRGRGCPSVFVSPKDQVEHPQKCLLKNENSDYSRSR